jgi:DNA-binding NarL/FixJ family response regulator
MISVLVVAAQPLQRFGLRMLLESAPDTEIVGEAENGAEAVRWTTELCPDVVLMDIRMPGVDKFADQLGDDRSVPAREDPRLNSLTRREREILVAIGQGLTNGEIAHRFTLSESTVKTHVGRVLAKIGARDRIQAVILTYDLRLTRPADLAPQLAR